MKKAGVPTQDLIRLYKCFLVSITDYASVVYHPLLTAGQAKRIEDLQAAALKIIYRYNLSYAELLEMSGLDRLSERRLKLLDKFIFFFFHPADPRGSHREVYQEFQPSYDIFRRWCQGLFRPQVPCTPSLHCPIANSASTQSQQPV